MTKIILGILVGLFIINLVGRGLVTQQLALIGLLVADGQYWRLVTYGFTVSGFLNMVVIGLMIWFFAGRPLENQLGSWRFLLLYVLSGLGGATLLYAVGSATVGSFGGAISSVLGLLGANAVFKQRRGEDIRPDLGLVALLVVLNLVLGWGGSAWVSLVGGAVAGALVGLALAYAPPRRRTMAQVAGMGGVALLCALVVAGKTLVSYGMI
jgi:membrane associated rhomboid family serine protease